MMKSEEERAYYRILSRIRKLIETKFSQLEEFGERFIRAVSRRGLAVKIILSFNVYQMMRGKLMVTRVDKSKQPCTFV
jgi:hypothetical protein